MSYASEVAADSPVFVLPMGESSGNLTDTVGSKTATAYGSPTYGVTGPVTGYTAIDLASGSDYFTVADHADLDLGDGPFTIEFFYARDADNGTFQALLTKGSTAYVVYVDAGGSSYPDKMHLGKYDSNPHIVSDSTIPSDGSWHHYAFTRSVPGDNATNDILYIDGAEAGADLNYTATLLDTTSVLEIGRDTASFPALGKLAWIAFYKSALSGTRIAAHYAARNVAGPVWTTPADTVGMSLTPDLQFNSPTSAVAQHFQLQLDTANTFDTGNLRTYDSSASQTNWTYWNGSSWTALPSTGLPSGSSGNEVRYSVTSALSTATWYRRVRAGTGV